MPEFTAKDVQALRQATGAGMMDAKKALQENDGDMEAATQWLREKGLAKVAKLGDRENTQGSVAAVVDGNVGAIVELKSETDFSAKADDFTSLVQELAELVVAKGTDARRRAEHRARRPQDRQEGEHRGRHRSSASRRPTATSSTPTCTCRTAAASTPCSSSSTAAPRSWPTTSPCTSPSPSRRT